MDTLAGRYGVPPVGPPRDFHPLVVRPAGRTKKTPFSGLGEGRIVCYVLLFNESNYLCSLDGDSDYSFFVLLLVSFLALLLESFARDSSTASNISCPSDPGVFSVSRREALSSASLCALFL